MTLPAPGQPRRWPLHRERYVTKDRADNCIMRLNAARADERAERTWPPGHAFRNYTPDERNTAWRIGQHAGKLFRLRELSREAHEAKR